MGEDVPQLRHLREHDRLAQHLALGSIGEGEPGAERDQQDAGEDRAAGRGQREASRQQHRQEIEEQTRRPGRLGAATRRGISQAASAETPPTAICSASLIAHYGEWIWKR